MCSKCGKTGPLLAADQLMAPLRHCWPKLLIGDTDDCQLMCFCCRRCLPLRLDMILLAWEYHTTQEKYFFCRGEQNSKTYVKIIFLIFVGLRVPKMLALLRRFQEKFKINLHSIYLPSSGDLNFWCALVALIVGGRFKANTWCSTLKQLSLFI